jgi:hypothetical protein
MPASNWSYRLTSGYARGATAERVVRDMATEAGLLVIRAAGSKGVADLVVIGNAVCGEVWAVNVKRSRWAGPAERLTMWEAWQGRDVVPILAYVVVEAERDKDKRTDRRKRTVVWWREVQSGGELGAVTKGAPW